MRQDDLVDKAFCRLDKGVCETLFIFPGALGDLFGIAYVLPEADFDRALCAHHRDFGGVLGIVQVAAQMLGRHLVIVAAIGPAGDDGSIRHRSLAIGEPNLEERREGKAWVSPGSSRWYPFHEK